MAAAAAAALLPLPASAVRLWRRDVYLKIQPTVTGAASQVPFSLLDVLVVSGVVTLAGLWIVRVARAPRGRRGAALWGAVAWTSVLGSGLYLLFLGMWGLNYRAEPVTRRLDYDVSRVNAGAVARLARLAVAQVNALHAEAHATAWPAAHDLPAALGPAFAEAQRLLGARDLARPAAPKSTMLGGYFRRAAVAGMVDPFFLQVLITPDALPFETPAILAHEWGHLAGYANEAEASFVGWLTCMHGSVQARYSGWLALVPRLIRDLPPPSRAVTAAKLAPGPREDLAAIDRRLAQAVIPALNRVAWAGYDRFLKANRVTAGVRSYDHVVTLVAGTAFDRGWRPRLATPARAPVRPSREPGRPS